MFKMPSRAVAFCAAMIAGVAAVALSGLTASVQAFPNVAPVQAASAYEAAQYYDDGYPHPMRHHRYRGGYDHYGSSYGYDHGYDDGRHGYHRYGHHRFGENAHPRHPGQAGLYDCGPGGKATRLSRKACGGNDRFRHLDQPYY